MNIAGPVRAQYLPVTGYRAYYQEFPVTTYETLQNRNACTGQVTTSYRPVTTYQKRLQYTPYTTHQVVTTPITPLAQSTYRAVVCPNCVPPVPGAVDAVGSESGDVAPEPARPIAPAMDPAMAAPVWDDAQAQLSPSAADERADFSARLETPAEPWSTSETAANESDAPNYPRPPAGYRSSAPNPRIPSPIRDLRSRPFAPSSIGADSRQTSLDRAPAAMPASFAARDEERSLTHPSAIALSGEGQVSSPRAMSNSTWRTERSPSQSQRNATVWRANRVTNNFGE